MERMDVDQETMVNKKNKAFTNRHRLEMKISIACEEILDITLDMFVEAKIVQLGHIVY